MNKKKTFILSMISFVLLLGAYCYAGSTDTEIGNYTYHSDGSTSNQIGNHMYHSDGSSSLPALAIIHITVTAHLLTQIGNHIYNSNGSSSTQ